MIKVRFAPSPTGFLHIGGLRTALYNYLFARHSKGSFVLRVEDTDRARSVEGAAEGLIEILKWAGLEFDEVPYYQSKRIDIYKEHAEKLLQSGNAYRCFCTTERLEGMRKEQTQNKQMPKYDGLCRKLSKEESYDLSKTKPFTVRMIIPQEDITFSDIIRGEVSFHGSLLDDQVILKSDGYPTYHLANVVDDHLMEISHVIRGEEWLSSTPKHIVLYRYFGWQPPKFAHLSLLLNPDRSKLSKRQGDVAVENYRDNGYLKEALLNYVALLGWSTEDSQQIFAKEELINKFTLERCGKSGAVFDKDKLLWMNGEYIRKAAPEKLAAEAMPFILKAGIDVSDKDYITECVKLEQEKVSLLSDIPHKIDFLVKNDYNIDPKALERVIKTPDILNLLSDLKVRLSGLETFGAGEIENLFRAFAKEKCIKTSPVFHTVRVATSGRMEGPSLFHYLELLGKERTLSRVDKFLVLLREKCR